MKFEKYLFYQRGSGSSVGIATELRAGRSGIESRCGRDFPDFQNYTLYTIKLKICTQRFYYSSSKFSEFIQGKSPVLQ